MNIDNLKCAWESYAYQSSDRKSNDLSLRAGAIHHDDQIYQLSCIYVYNFHWPGPVHHDLFKEWVWLWAVVVRIIETYIVPIIGTTGELWAVAVRVIELISYL